jgi:hypothetical protein
MLPRVATSCAWCDRRMHFGYFVQNKWVDTCERYAEHKTAEGLYTYGVCLDCFEGDD